MTKLSPPTDPVEALGETYELVLERILDRLRIRDPHHRAEAGEVDALLEELSREFPRLAGLDDQARKRLRETLQRELAARHGAR